MTDHINRIDELLDTGTRPATNGNSNGQVTRVAFTTSASHDLPMQYDEDDAPSKLLPRRARVRSWAEFRMQRDFRFRMAGWLPTQGTVAFAGAEHSGKSILAVDAALRCVLGDAVDAWCGHTVREPCSSLYIMGEDPQGIMLRAEAFIHERVGGEFGKKFAESLTCDGRTINFVDRMPGPLADPVGILELRQLIEDFKDRHGHKPGIVWLDTSSTLYGGDENDNAAMGQFAKTLGELADEHQLLIVLIHHLRKPSTLKAPARPSGADLRGAGCLAGNFDVVVLIWRKDPDDRLAPVEVFIHKGKNGGTTGTGHWLASHWVSLRQNEDGDDIGAPILVPHAEPASETEQGKHAKAMSNVQRIAFRMIAALRDPAKPSWTPNQTDAETLTHGKGPDKRQAWQWLVKQAWVVNTGKSRSPCWEVSEQAPPSLDPRFEDTTND